MLILRTEEKTDGTAMTESISGTQEETSSNDTANGDHSNFAVVQRTAILQK